ncbi:proton extrusion protein PcxA [Brunnivagina elsteri]|uniref:Proton extrusion protein PxcA n=1 Tax=Brunnivagina elsteri CCALA 953 TaxID=987040 RepID=A0A2A2TRD5_9CYAN|nr:proton extrusion protein PcxA [Calothrix elsteri]PAX60718.1 proton extrusion protein PcxA [Calothrix elsteri CCALA 953]
MNNLSLTQKIYLYLVSLYKWYLKTPQRSLDEAYAAALHIKQIEDEHFNGNKISFDLTTSSGVNIFFESDLRKQLKVVRMRLTEFNSSRLFLNEANQKGAIKYGVELIEPTEVLEKLKIIDEITVKYQESDFDGVENFSQSNFPLLSGNNSVIKPSSNSNNNSQIIQSNGAVPPQEYSKVNNGQRSKANTTGVLPRSILSTISRLQVELDPNAEQDVVQKFRKAQRRTIISVRFILLLIIVPILTHQLAKAFVVGPIVDHVRNQETVKIFINYEMEEEALVELQRFEERIKFQNLIGLSSPLSAEAMEVQLKDKAREIAQEYRGESASAIKNVFADIISVIAFSILLMVSKREIAVLKDFFDHVVYGLSDSAKAFIIILFTDIFVGFHSPHGWEVILEGISRHWGLPGNHSFIFLFIATFPVILDTIFKYWIFRYLNRVSPSAVATYHNMNE